MVRWKILIGTIAFSFVISSCSTTREEIQESTIEITAPLPTKTDAEKERLTNENLELKHTLQKNQSEITLLLKQIESNNAELFELNTKLNEQEEKILFLQNSSNHSSITSLKLLEDEKSDNRHFEARYLALKLKDNELRNKLAVLEAENLRLTDLLSHTLKEKNLVHQATKECTESLEFNSTPNAQIVVSPERPLTEECLMESDSGYENVINLQALNDEYSKTVLDLLNKQKTLVDRHALLTDRHKTLEQQYLSLEKDNQGLRDSYLKIKQKNFDLGGAIADSRAQHQVLWDRISVQDKIIAELQADANFKSERKVTGDLVLARNAATTVESEGFSGESLRQENNRLQSKIDQLEKMLEVQQTLLSKYQAHTRSAVEQLAPVNNAELAELQRNLENLSKINRNTELSLAAVRSELDLNKVKESKLNKEMTELKDERNRIESELRKLSLREKALTAEKSALEKQINALIPFEAEVNFLEDQLKSNIANVRWQRPTAMPLNSAFEVIVTADVENVVPGQVYVAELVVDTAFDLISATEAEAVVENGKLTWRWRISGLSAHQAARADLFIHQQIQYHDQRFSRQVYRDQTLVTLENDDFWEKYGFWCFAIFAGLLGGFFVGRLGKSKE
ncbi:hypothetical protein O1D97_18285 [Marinomonas sp. 15G1-11]|uniref:Chromosome partition protein Smc n=1 Tax=Marinomonas phaeophyticola TaxID=3004091 RepID=A0ABT4JZ12_9GAMM|nr:hypothetical protein [Marinomonas sp. 15G1-11]MCZ2723508.1 hypothetical protein [Marinomonas sp. 15G1-11]